MMGIRTDLEAKTAATLTGRRLRLVNELPVCTSVAVAEVTSLSARLCTEEFDNCSASLTLSEADARVRRTQSTSARLTA